MLHLQRGLNQEVLIQVDGKRVLVKVSALKGNQVRLSFDASPDVLIDRKEIWEWKQLQVKPL